MYTWESLGELSITTPQNDMSRMFHYNFFANFHVLMKIKLTGFVKISILLFFQWVNLDSKTDLEDE